MEADEKNKNEDLPPIAGTWNKLYALVIGELVTLIILFYIFTRIFE